MQWKPTQPFWLLIFHHVREVQWSSGRSDRLQKQSRRKYSDPGQSRWELTPCLAATYCWITSYVTWNHISLAAVLQVAELSHQKTTVLFVSFSTLKPSSEREYPERGNKIFHLICLIWFLGWSNYAKIMELGMGNHWLILTLKLVKILGWAHGDWLVGVMNGHAGDKSTLTQYVQNWIKRFIFNLFQKSTPASVRACSG